MNSSLNKVWRNVVVGLGLVGASTAALAGDKHYQDRGHRDSYRDVEYARVVDVDPIIRRVRISSPQRECYQEDVPVNRGSRTEARSTLIGGLIGAAVGHRVAHHNNDLPNGLAVVGGSIIGAAIGNNVGVNRAARNGEYDSVGYRTVERCQVSYRDQWEEQVDGYRVTYVYHGREYTTRLPYDPGNRLRVDVDVRPVGRY